MKDWEMMPASRPVATCDICGGGVAGEEQLDAALTLGGTMCPTPMTFHRSCYEAAQAMLGRASDTLLCEAPAEDERGREIERLLDQIPSRRTE
jgi:hypothetical protein